MRIAIEVVLVIIMRTTVATATEIALMSDIEIAMDRDVPATMQTTVVATLDMLIACHSHYDMSTNHNQNKNQVSCDQRSPWVFS